MTQRQKLYACWRYVVSDGGFYYGGPDPNLDESGWARNEALRMFNTGVGNCYGFSCIFAALETRLAKTKTNKLYGLKSDDARFIGSIALFKVS